MPERKIFVGKTIFTGDRAKNRLTPWLGPISQRDIQMGILSPVSQSVCAWWGGRGLLLCKASCKITRIQEGFALHKSSLWYCRVLWAPMQKVMTVDHCHTVPHPAQSPASPSWEARHREYPFKKEERETLALLQERKWCNEALRTSEEKSLSSYGFREDFAQRWARRRQFNQAVPIVRFPVASPCCQWEGWAKINILKVKKGKEWTGGRTFEAAC